MNWNMLRLAVDMLNVDTLIEWKDTFLTMDVWMQAILVGVLVLLTGVAFLSCFLGFRMKKAARFAAGAASVFYIGMIILTEEYELSNGKALIYASIGAAAAGLIYAFVERLFQFAAGAVFGSVLSVWLLPTFFHVEAVEGSGRIWTIVIMAAGGILFALGAKKLKLALTALEGGVVLGLLCDVFLPVDRIPWISEKLSLAQIRNLVPIVIAALGFVIQLIQFLVIWREQRALRIPAGEEQESGSGVEKTQDASDGSGDGTAGEASGQDAQEEGISIAQAEEVLVEKAKELALAAARSTQQVRLKERCEDVAQGLYDAKTAADRLGMTEEAFLQEMKKAGFSLPQDSEAKEKGDGSTAAGSSNEGTESKTEVAGSSNESAESIESKTEAAGSSSEGAESSMEAAGSAAIETGNEGTGIREDESIESEESSAGADKSTKAEVISAREGESIKAEDSERPKAADSGRNGSGNKKRGNRRRR
jgi:hypothetical protein